jgi:hypothetical protein
MAALVAATHFPEAYHLIFEVSGKWVAGTSPAMTRIN